MRQSDLSLFCLTALLVWNARCTDIKHTQCLFLLGFILSRICFNAANNLLHLHLCPLGLIWCKNIHQPPDLQRDWYHWWWHIWKTLSKRCWVQAIVLWRGIVNIFLLLEGSPYCQTPICKWNSFYGKSFPLSILHFQMAEVLGVWAITLVWQPRNYCFLTFFPEFSWPAPGLATWQRCWEQGDVAGRAG